MQGISKDYNVNNNDNGEWKVGRGREGEVRVLRK